MSGFGFLLFNEVEELDFVGPWEMISTWSKISYDGPDKVLTVSQEGGQVVCTKSLKISIDYSFADCPPLDYLLIPGGWGTREESTNKELLNFIQQQAQCCQWVLSVCTGALLLQAAGLLDGKKATTHWNSLDQLRACKSVTVVEERVVRDGNIWTSAGVSSGIDLALEFIAAVAGEETAGRVQYNTEFFPMRKIYGSASKNKAAPGYIKRLQDK